MAKLGLSSAGVAHSRGAELVSCGPYYMTKVKSTLRVICGHDMLLMRNIMRQWI